MPNLHNPKPLQSLTQAPYTTTEIHSNTHKGHKTQQPPHHFPHSHIPLPTSSFSVTLIPQISIASLTKVNLPNSHCL
jgi:hypothetical protein